MPTPHNPTDYQKFLQQVSNQIVDQAWKALENQYDSAQLQQLERGIHPDPEEHARLEALDCLKRLEAEPDKSGFAVWLAMLWAGQARVPAPMWAVQQFDTIGSRYLYDDTLRSLAQAFGGKPDSKQKLLDKAFGFVAIGSGRTAELKAGAHREQYDKLCRRVWVLTLCGITDMEACRMVARWRQQQPPRNSPCELRDIMDVEAFAGLLQGDTYYPWREANAEWLRRAEPHWREWLATNKQEYLSRFHPDSAS